MHDNQHDNDHDESEMNPSRALLFALGFGIPAFFGTVVLGPVAPLITSFLVALGIEWLVTTLETIKEKEVDKHNFFDDEGV